MKRQQLSIVLVISTAVLTFVVGGAARADSRPSPAADPAGEIAGGVSDDQLRQLLLEVLDRNPRIARLVAEAAAAEQRAPQVKGPPDPVATLTWWVLPPQTRTGPQHAAINISQRLPWFGTLERAEKAALWDAAVVRGRLDSARLEALTEARIGYLELQFLDAEQRVLADDVATLAHYTELALARYAAGVGRNQEVIKLDAEITRVRARLLGVDERRAAVVARLNAMRDRPQSVVVDVAEPLPIASEVELDPVALRERAMTARPEMRAAAAAAEAASIRTELARKGAKPDIFFGLNYGAVERRNDAAGRLNPPENNGDDVLGLSAGMSVPVWRSRVDAEIEESVQRVLAADEARREAAASIDRALGELIHRIPLLREQVRLYDEVLVTQAEASLESAESAYSVGTADALDLLDAERVLLQVRIAAERARADLKIAHARLEGAVAGLLDEENGQ